MPQTSVSQPTPAITYTRPQTAAMLNMALRTLDGHIAARRIGFCKVGGKVLFRECDIESFLARYAVAPREMSGAI